MSQDLTKSYKKGITDIETEFMIGAAGERSFEDTLNHILRESERSAMPNDMARLAGQAHALVHLADKGLVKTNPKKRSEKQEAAIARSREVLRKAHAILASRGCSFKDAMVTAWQEAKMKKNSGGRGMTHMWRQAMDGNDWAQFEMARQGMAYNVPSMYANRGRARRNGSNPTRGQDALWLQAYDGQPWAQFEMARTGRSYNVPNMWAGQAYANPGLKKGQNIMKEAAKRYRRGDFDSMQEAVSAVAAERRGR